MPAEMRYLPRVDNTTSAHPERGSESMGRAVLERILQALKTLGPEELRQVQQAVEAQLRPTDDAPEEEQVLQEMLKPGLLTEIKPRCMVRRVEYPLVSIQRKPLSETIIEERR